MVPRELRTDGFHQMHGRAHVGGHLGRDRTYVRVRMRAWWLQIGVDKMGKGLHELPVSNNRYHVTGQTQA